MICFKYDVSYGVIVELLLIFGGVEKNFGFSLDLFNVKFSFICIVYNNVCSLYLKVDIVIVEMFNFDVICISEIYFDNFIYSDLIVIDGFYFFFRKDRNRWGGGVVIYILSYLFFIEWIDLLIFGLEILWVEINVNCKKIFVGVLYWLLSVLVDYWNFFCLNFEKVV